MCRYLARILPGIVLCSLAMAQSTPATLNPKQLVYFRVLLNKIGSPSMPEAIAKEEEVSLQGRLHLSKAEGAVLHTIGQQFKAKMSELRASERSIVVGKTELTDADRLRVADLVQIRDQTVNTLAASLMNSVTTTTANKLLQNASLQTLAGGQ